MNGTQHFVYLEITQQRTRYTDGQWSEWHEVSKRFFTRDSHVNPPDSDGWYEVLQSGARIRP